MLREFVISIYLVVFKLIFNIFHIYPQKEKTVCVASFGDNIFYAVKAIRQFSDQEIIILKDSNCHYPFDPSIGTILNFSVKHPISFIKSIYHITTGKTILIDNYFGFLAACNFKQSTRCIQLWHAAGALKQFGLMDPSITKRTEKAKQRFRQVYQRFDYTVVGSEHMADIFKRSFALTDNQIWRTGIPRTDFFYDELAKKESIRDLHEKFPVLKEKKVILYAPTFRNGQLSHFQSELNIKKLRDSLKDEYILLVKYHPAVQARTEAEAFPDFVYDVSSEDINSLLLITDILVTDYSSIPFEFALLERPMIFYAYDLEEYMKTTGIIENYMDLVPGPIVYNTEEIIEVIQGQYFDMKKVKEFAEEWNRFSKGNSSEQLALKILDSVPAKEKAL